MAILNQKRILNLIPKTSAPVTIHVSQGDVGTEIEFTLVKGDELFVDTGSLTASVHGVREDGANFGAFTCTLSGSSVKFPLHSEMTMVKGSAIAEIVLVDSQGNKVGSANFGIMVEESVFPLGVTYDNDVSVYESILAYVQTIPAQVTQDYNTKINAETAARQAADSSLNEALMTEEQSRISSDDLLSTRIDEIIAPSGEAPSAAEVTDARIGANGKTYSSLGTAIRTQITDIKSALAHGVDNGGLIIYLNLGEYITTNGVITPTTEDWACTNYIDISSLRTLNIKTTKASVYNCFFDSEKEYISSFYVNNGDNTINIPQNAKYIVMSGETVYMKQMFIEGALVQDINDLYSKVEKINSNVVILQHTIAKIEIDNALNPKIRIYPSSGTSIYLYGLNRKCKQEVQIALTVGESGYIEYEVNAFASLIWDTEAQTIKTVASNVGNANNCFVLASCIRYAVTDGYFLDLYLKNLTAAINTKISKTVDILSNINKFDVDNQGEFDVHRVMFHFDGSLTIRGYNDITKTFAEIKNDIGALYVYAESSSGIFDCIYIPQGYFMIFDLELNKYQIVQWAYKETQIIVAENRNGFLCGRLAEIYYGKIINDSNFKNTVLPRWIIDEVESKEFPYVYDLDENVFKMLLSTDTHNGEGYDGKRDTTQYVIEKLDKDIDADAILNGGDVIRGATGEKNPTIEQIATFKKGITAIEKVINVVGNHDYGGSGILQANISYVLSHKELYNLLGRNLRNNANVVWGSKAGMYYYIDYPQHNIRLIVLNTSLMPETHDVDGVLEYNSLLNGGVNQDQVEWLCEVALQVPTTTHVLIATHYPLWDARNGINTRGNMPQIRSILEAFKNGTSVSVLKTSTEMLDVNADGQVVVVQSDAFNLDYSYDFSSQGARTIIGCCAGHNHSDDMTVINGIHYWTTIAGYNDPSLPVYNPDEDIVLQSFGYALDLVAIDTTNRTVTMRRFGYGDDRSFSY